ncbi:hypothetical protein E2P81_ATG08650 [Venturia nashicola]|uniref:CST complex subunit Stn1 N-terminal domain-containing protein n=1 Tax=Venturia nashicola TaxID=86259 RepID=A0A4Z1P475_9PEZI|nr:hypothetical protein E6O75_ATG08840 [Venturia nashicola]TLD20986.1 hypothetical protein E2P81_ATG08650 [Venturia nashicola]
MNIIYPAYTFRASPTYFAWVKLTCADIHALRSEPGFEGQGLYFHLNHPIRFISITAPIISIESITDRYTILELDDGSGSTIVVKITRLSKDQLLANHVDSTSNTTVENVNIVSKIGVFNVFIDGHKKLDIGTVIKVKAVIGEFRKVKQLELKRIYVIRSTGDEVKEWAEVARWKRDILSKPWILPPQKLKELDSEDARERRKQRESEKKKKEYNKAKDEKLAKRREKIERHEAKIEKRRKAIEDELNGGALKGSDVLWVPWQQ